MSVSTSTSGYIGPIASGDKVMAVEALITKYREFWPKLLGVEMDAGGAAAAAYYYSCS